MARWMVWKVTEYPGGKAPKFSSQPVDGETLEAVVAKIRCTPLQADELRKACLTKWTGHAGECHTLRIEREN